MTARDQLEYLRTKRDTYYHAYSRALRAILRGGLVGEVAICWRPPWCAVSSFTAARISTSTPYEGDHEHVTGGTRLCGVGGAVDLSRVSGSLSVSARLQQRGRRNGRTQWQWPIRRNRDSLYLAWEQHVREYRLRRDDSQIEGGKPKAKYLSPPGRGGMLYFAVGTAPEWLQDPMLPVIVTEGEFKTLALFRAAIEGLGDAAEGPRFLPVGLGGVWNWRGTIGKTVSADGSRVDEKGPIPDLSRVAWAGRSVVICFDRDAETNEKVQIARAMLSKELRGRGAKVSWFQWPVEAPEAKGMDDLLAARGPEFVLPLIEVRIAAATEQTPTSACDDVILSAPFTDLGNAERFAALHAGDIRYCHPWKAWLIWNGSRFKLDDTGEITRRAKAVTRKMFQLAARSTDTEKRDRLLKFARFSEKHARLQAMLSLAACEPGIPVLPQDLDADPWLLNIDAGTIDLKRGELLPHSRENLITKQAPVDFDPSAQCPQWLKFLDEIMGGNQELITFKQRALGYALSGLVTEKRGLFIYHGSGNNRQDHGTRTHAGLAGQLCRTNQDRVADGAASSGRLSRIAGYRGSKRAQARYLKRTEGRPAAG